jgi:predicted nucleotidyltransferase component of viral defense system
MTAKKITDLAASVHARLLKKAQESGRPYNELSQNYFMERFLYRLSRSKHAGRFCLKGALMFVGWNAPAYRPTKDIDLLGQIECSVETLVSVFRNVCRQPVEPDGLSFDPDSVQGEEIAEDAEYGGVRVLVNGRFHQNARVRIQVDVGFGDKVVPSPTPITLKPILDFPAPHLQGYTRESSIAEKFDAMVKRGARNSRMKDYYDIWFLSQNYGFSGEILAKAISETFRTRGRTFKTVPDALTHLFAERNRAAWRSFIRRSTLRDAPDDFAEVVAAVRAFLTPPVNAIAAGKQFDARWSPHGPWAHG